MKQILSSGDRVRLIDKPSWLERLFPLVFVALVVGVFAYNQHGLAIERFTQWREDGNPLFYIVVALFALTVLRTVYNVFFDFGSEWMFSYGVIEYSHRTIFGTRRKSWHGEMVTAIVLESERDDPRRYRVDLRLRSGKTIKLPLMHVDDRNELARALEEMYPSAKWVIGKSEPRSEWETNY